MTTQAEVRAWMRESGEDVGTRGTVAQSDIDRYEAAHAPGPDYPPGMNDDDFTISEPGPPPADAAEKKPRNIATAKPAERFSSWRKAKAKAKPKGKAKPRVPVDDLIAGLWRGLAGFARPLPATSRLLKIQAPVAGVILEDVVKGTVVDKWMQPLARTTKAVSYTHLTVSSRMTPATGAWILRSREVAGRGRAKPASPRHSPAMRSSTGTRGLALPLGLALALPFRQAPNFAAGVGVAMLRGFFSAAPAGGGPGSDTSKSCSVMPSG